MIFLKAISNCHYHKFMFKIWKKTIQGKKHHNRCIVKIAKNRSWNNVINELAANISWEHSCIIQWGLPQNMHFLLHRFSLSQGFDQGGLGPERPEESSVRMAFCIDAASIPINLRSFMRFRLSSSSAPIKKASSSPFSVRV